MKKSLITLAATTALSIGFVGCNIIEPPLPNAIPGVTLEVINEIATRPGLADEDRIAMVIELLGLEDSPEAQRIAIFLLQVQLQ